jgi:hypothetical protein
VAKEREIELNVRKVSAAGAVAGAALDDELHAREKQIKNQFLIFLLSLRES